MDCGLTLVLLFDGVQGETVVPLPPIVSDPLVPLNEDVRDIHASKARCDLDTSLSSSDLTSLYQTHTQRG